MTYNFHVVTQDRETPLGPFSQPVADALAELLAMDPPVSEKQRRAMYAAAEGKSNLGIPKRVGEEFVGRDTAAGVRIRAEDGRTLFVRRTKAGDTAGTWAFPGGKIEDGEEPAGAARRELQEEIGWTPGELRDFDRRELGDGAYRLFDTLAEEAFDPTLNAEHDQFVWAMPKDAPQPLHPGVLGSLGEDMEPDDWKGLVTGLLKFLGEEAKEPQHAQDSMALDRDSVRTKDKDGRLHVARVRLTKANICPYRGNEIPGWEELGLEPDRVYQLFRAPEEIEKAAKSSNNMPLLEVHKPVSAAEHPREIVVGTVGSNAEWDGTYLWNSLVVWDGEAIKDVESEEKRELSAGYYYKPVMTPGEFMGAKYDGVMTEIVFNHEALVERGRAGADVVIGDSALVEKWDLTRFTFA